MKKPRPVKLARLEFRLSKREKWMADAICNAEGISFSSLFRRVLAVEYANLVARQQVAPKEGS